MSLHQRQTHGRVLVGQEALDHLSLHRRDSHGDRIKMVVPEGFRAFAQKDVVVDTVVSQVFVTIPQTSPTAGTDGLNLNPTGPVRVTQGGGTTRQTASQTQAARTSSGSQHSTTRAPSSTGGASNSAGTGRSTTSAPSSGYYNGYNSADAARASASSTSLSDANNAASSDVGMAAKVGIAVGAIVGLALLGFLLFFCLRRRKSGADKKNVHNEKYDSMFGAQQKVPEPLDTNRTTSPAPQLSLRPVTQFLPNLGENRKSGDLLGAASANTSKSAWERRQTENPFADSSTQEKSRPTTPNVNPFDENRTQPEASHLANISDRPTGNAPVQKADTELGASAAPGAQSTAMPVVIANRAVNPEQRGANNVHRVQLDFKPSMDDELELRSGQLVRMLHEYDDGWALCVRMDRSQQGVCPRTCLSKLPVKPRQGPPPSANGRPYGPGPNGPINGGPPQGRPRMGPGLDSHVDGPAQQYSPNSNNGMYPRPLTPNGNPERAGSPNGPARPGVGQAF